jgi:hypothetical protein
MPRTDAQRKSGLILEVAKRAFIDPGANAGLDGIAKTQGLEQKLYYPEAMASWRKNRLCTRRSRLVSLSRPVFTNAFPLAA